MLPRSLEHGIGLPHAGGRAEENLERAAALARLLILEACQEGIGIGSLGSHTLRPSESLGKYTLIGRRPRGVGQAGSVLIGPAVGNPIRSTCSVVHQVINHAEAYARGKVHTNGLQNFWSLLTRSMKGTYVSVEPFHLFRYLGEQSFRFNTRKANDAERFRQLVGGVAGRPLAYQTTHRSEPAQYDAALDKDEQSERERTANGSNSLSKACRFDGANSCGSEIRSETSTKAKNRNPGYVGELCSPTTV